MMGVRLMRKKAAFVVTISAPILLLWLGHWVSGFAHFTAAPSWASPAYWGLFFYYLFVAAFLYFLFTSEYTGKMWIALMIPCVCLIFFSLPYGIFWEEMGGAFMVFHPFFPGYPCVFILFFSFLLKLVQVLKKDN